MKKRGVSLIVVVAIAILVLFVIPKFTGDAVSSLNCIESDNGRDYYSKGSIEYGSAIKGSDYCMNEGILKEYYCENNQARTEAYACLDGCENGACRQIQAPPIPATLSAEKNNTWIIWVVGIVLVVVIALILIKRKK